MVEVTYASTDMYHMCNDAYIYTHTFICTYSPAHIPMWTCISLRKERPRTCQHIGMCIYCYAAICTHEFVLWKNATTM